ncbi:L-methionine/branched-chain amino acid transporter [Budviciaceae bacterium BWR-B9]|uniref:L-methionine/branched-chain amino acid transporter n=1 Tax=Limnobaculum allomyrinae TaxID=2791986 RepID=A0ABS1IMN6_9GAMM|nr:MULTISPECIES: L-methionine/branched-chain amino acid transporter [Limnobaculum]MBK5143015.1 L-methionine/branched-chain amino acid transporter [Limnobaculum allomyrinae]MBV7693345.1 L-methionine/branched-chain amino acid transporter [Limnobaculum sp. M2-1]
MSGLKQELGLVQGVGLLSTSLLGTGVFAVPALAAQIADSGSLWAWPVLIILVFPIAIAFAALGRHFPNAGGAAHFVSLAFGPHMARVTGWLFLSVIPVGLPAALQIASGFWQAAFGLEHSGLLLVQLGTLLAILLLGMRSAGSSANVQVIIAGLIVAMVVAIWWKGGITPGSIQWPALSTLSASPMFSALAVMFWCFVGLEAFAHLAAEFRNPERDFPRALLIGMLVAGGVYWSCTAAVLAFHSYGGEMAASASLPSIVVQLFGQHALWVACIIGYLACFASLNIYTQSFARLVWSQTYEQKPKAWVAQLSRSRSPLNALSLVLLCCLISSLAADYFSLELDELIVYANGIFVFIYLLCMLSGCRLLKGSSRAMSFIGTALCILLLVMIGWKTLYAVVMFALLWLILPRRKQAAEASVG